MAEITTLPEAIDALVTDGDLVALEGFTHLIPFAAGHEIIRQGRRDLTLARMTPDVVYDQMIGMGCARRLIFSWGGNPGVGSLHRLRDAVEHGWPHPLELDEHTHAGMANRYVAGASGLPMAVLRGYAGTDLVDVTPAAATVTCPFTGEVLTAVPALNPDVTVIHAQQSDRAGNVMLWGITGVQREAVLAARRSLVTVEEIVDHLDPRPGSVVLPGWAVTVVAHVPGGAHPSYAAGYSRRDNAFYSAWDGISRDRDAFLAWMRQEVVFRGRARAAAPVAPAPPVGQVEAPGGFTADEMMTVAAARCLADGDVCLVGIGLPGLAASLARRLHAPACVLIYESGAVGAKPSAPPLSIGDGELAETADTVVSVPELFDYWLQAGRIDVGLLGAAQIDRFARLNTTVIGPYASPTVRLPGAGGASEIASSARRVLVVLRHTRRAFVDRLDFRTSVPRKGRSVVVTDLGVMKADSGTGELVLTSVHPGATVGSVCDATGWELRVASDVATTPAPTAAELDVLRSMGRVATA